MSLNKIEQSVIDKYFASALNGPVTKHQDIIVEEQVKPKEPVKVKHQFSRFIRPDEEFSDFEESDDENENKSQSDNEEIIVNDIEAIYNMQKGPVIEMQSNNWNNNNHKINRYKMKIKQKKNKEKEKRKTNNRNKNHKINWYKMKIKKKTNRNKNHKINRYKMKIKQKKNKEKEKKKEDEQPEQKSQNQLVQNENKGEELSENGPISTTINSSVSAASSNGEQENGSWYQCK